MTFAAVQEALKLRPRKGQRRGYATKSDAGWLKPVLYCGGCGRGMKTTVLHGKRGSCCQSYQMRYQRPGDKRFECSVGLNWIRHDELEPLLVEWLDGVDEEMLREIGVGNIERLQGEIVLHETQAKQRAMVGFRNHLRLIWDALDMEDRPGAMHDLILRLMKTVDAAEQFEGLAVLEPMLAPVVEADLAKCREEHRDFSKAMIRPTATPRQMVVWEEECQRLEVVIAKLERLVTPFPEQAELAAQEYQSKRDQLEEARESLRQSHNRIKGAAMARIFSRVVVFAPEEKQPGKKNRQRAIAAVLVWTDTLKERLLTV